MSGAVLTRAERVARLNDLAKNQREPSTANQTQKPGGQHVLLRPVIASPDRISEPSSAVGQIVQVVPARLIPIGPEVLAPRSIYDTNLGFRVIGPVDPIFVCAALDVLDRIRLRAGRPELTGIAQTSDVTILVLPGLSHVTLCHS